MARKIRPPAPRKVKRNPLARDLATGKYRARVVPRQGAYRRRGKHPKPPVDDSS
jgi:hypothetical protein